jgi:hypothetical protein
MKTIEKSYLMLSNKDLKKIAQKCLLAVLLITPFVFVPIGEFNDFFYMPKVAYYTVIVSVFILFALFNLKQAVSLVSKDTINLLLGLFGLLLVISTLFAMDVELALSGSFRRVEGLSTMLTYLVLFLIARIAYPLKQKHFNYLLIVASVIALYGILQTFGIDPFPRDYIRGSWSRAFSTLGNPNFLGSYLVLMLPFATDQYMRCSKRWALIVYGVLLYALLATMTRGAWIGAGLSHLMYAGILLFNNKLDKKRAFIFIGITVGVFVFYNFLSSGLFLSRFLSIGKDVASITDKDLMNQAGSSRLFIWIYVGKIILRYPLLGVGLENLGNAFQAFYSQDIINHFGYMVIPDKAHNEYLHIAVTSGLFSLGVYVTLLGSVLRKMTSDLLNHPKRLALFSASVGYAIQAFFNISVVSVAYVFWIFLGLLATTNKTEKKEEVILNN